MLKKYCSDKSTCTQTADRKRGTQTRVEVSDYQGPLKCPNKQNKPPRPRTSMRLTCGVFEHGTRSIEDKGKNKPTN